MFGSDLLAPRHRIGIEYERFRDVQWSSVSVTFTSGRNQHRDKTVRRRCQAQRSGDRSPSPPTAPRNTFSVRSDKLECSALAEYVMCLRDGGCRSVRDSIKQFKDRVRHVV
jgi:hypothetical protein